MIVHSFDEVLREPKMLHAIEVAPGSQAKIALWRPVPWIGIGYFAVLLLIAYVMTKIPVLNWFYEVFAGFFSPAVYYTVLPIGLVILVFQVELDGMAPHWWLLAYVLYLRRPQRTLCGEEMPMPGTKIRYGGKIKIWWDLNAPRLHHGWITGGKVSTSVPVSFGFHIFRSHRVIRPDEGYKQLDGYEVDKKLRVRP